MASGYFSSPSNTLDPALFDGDALRENVRDGLLNSLYGSLVADVGMKEPWEWTHAWIAGSAASYQWSADRGNGDLDVLFGIDIPVFLDYNPHFPRFGASDMSAFVNEILKSKLWPKTRLFNVNGKTFEATFFWNPGTSVDISVIHPYAAYNLTENKWDVRPPELPADPHALYPHEWYDFSEADYRQAQALEQLDSQGPSGTVQAWGAAQTLWQSIHGGRHAAFSDTGRGYGDFHNFRWQRGKEMGTVDILRRLVSAAEEHFTAEQERLYGMALDEPAKIVRRAITDYSNPRYRA